MMHVKIKKAGTTNRQIASLSRNTFSITLAPFHHEKPGEPYAPGGMGAFLGCPMQTGLRAASGGPQSPVSPS
jgi:hypothetical protein